MSEQAYFRHISFIPKHDRYCIGPLTILITGMPAAFPWVTRWSSLVAVGPGQQSPCTRRTAGWGTCPVWTPGGISMAAQVTPLEESRWDWQYDVTLVLIILPQILLVTGGWGDYRKRLDSTELLRPGSQWQEITSARLPRPMRGVRVSTVDNRVLLFGEWW